MSKEGGDLSLTLSDLSVTTAAELNALPLFREEGRREREEGKKKERGGGGREENERMKGRRKESVSFSQGNCLIPKMATLVR